jgi:ferritin-like metal-binding protein YciE
MEQKDLTDLLVHTMKDVYFAENAIIKALPTMVKAASSPELKSAFQDHLKQTEGQVVRLEQVFNMLGLKPEGVPCEAIKGILKEGEEVASEFKGTAALDAGLIAAAQAVEHYEIARYGALCAWASELGLHDAEAILQETLAEEKDTDEALSELAEQRVNRAAEAGQGAALKRASHG